MRILVTTAVLLGSLFSGSVYATEKAQETVTLTKTELRTMVESLHDQLMAERAKEIQKAREAQRRELRERMVFNRGGDRR